MHLKKKHNKGNSERKYKTRHLSGENPNQLMQRIDYFVTLGLANVLLFLQKQYNTCAYVVNGQGYYFLIKDLNMFKEGSQKDGAFLDSNSIPFKITIVHCNTPFFPSRFLSNHLIQHSHFLTVKFTLR